jgi:hypothetical protein
VYRNGKERKKIKTKSSVEMEKNKKRSNGEEKGMKSIERNK